jgi:amidase
MKSAKELASLIRTKKLSCLELTSSCISQIESINPKINAVVQFNPEKALIEAKEKDSELSKGRNVGPLHGIPFTLKDVYNTKGHLVTAGCLGLKDNRADEDATIVKRLKKAGAILLGKTNTPELENAADTDNLVYGRTSNPYSLSHSAGGSSGGSAAIVAACGSVFDVGADTGGSLRIPSHYCGITSIRPTVQRIPSSGVVYGLRTGISGAFTTEGPLSRHVEDLPLLLSILQGPDGIDSKIVPAPLPAMEEVSLSTLKIAYSDKNQVVDTTDETKYAIQSACNALKDFGATIVEDVPKNFDQGFWLFQELLGANATFGFKEALDQLRVTKVSSLLTKLMHHLEPFSCDLATFMKRWDKWEFYRSKVLAFFSQYDVLIFPVTPDSALPHEEPMWNKNKINYASYAWTISATLLPVVVVKIGNSKEGLPIGVQIVTKPYQEHIGLAVAKCIEQKLGGWKMPTFKI